MHSTGRFGIMPAVKGFNQTLKGIRGSLVGERFLAVTLFVFLVLRDVEGLSSFRGIADGLLFTGAALELAGGMKTLRRLFLNPVFLTVFLFILSGLAACLLSPVPEISFREFRTPVLKGMVLVPLALGLCASGLFRRGWTAGRIARLLLVAFGLSGAGHLIWILGAYVQIGMDSGFSSDLLCFHRFRVYAVLLAFPFVVMSLRHLPRWTAVLMGLLAAGLAAVTVTSLSRGAWLALGAAILYLIAVNRAFITRKVVLRALPVLAACFIVFMITPPGEAICTRLSEGFYTSHRAGDGVWGATVDMIRLNPWRGYGYGDEVYDRTYNELTASHPHWSVPSSRGAHHVFLMHWFSAGVFGAAALLVLYAGYLTGIRQLLRRHRDDPAVRDLLHASVAAFISLYLILGQFETVRWHPLGTLLSLVLWLFLIRVDLGKTNGH